MISRIEKARETMEQLGWESPTSLQSCIAVPKLLSTSKFLLVCRNSTNEDGVVNGLLRFQNMNMLEQLEPLTK
jgi:hypothetical protein